jgi:hypothetical protein
VSASAFLGALVAVVLALRLAYSVVKRRRLPEPAGLRCPACQAPRLVVTAAIALPGSPSLDLEALACRRCTFRGAGVRTSDDHVGYPLAPLEWGRLSSSILRCPAPRDPACACAEHTSLGGSGAWTDTSARADRFEVV